MSKQYTANVSNVVYDPLDGLGLNRTVAADGLVYNKATFSGPTSDTNSGKNATPANLPSTQNNVSPHLIPEKGTAIVNTQSTGVSSSGASTTIDLTDDTVGMAEIVEVGDFILTNLGYVVRVKSIPSEYAITVDNAPDGTASASSVTGTQFWLLNQRAINQDTPGSYVGLLTNTTLGGGATEPNRNNNKLEVLRTTRTATAVRAGWNPITATFTTPPSTYDDTAALGIADDTAPGTSAKFVFMATGAAPTSTAINQ